jgi:LDH2 family malate/lactate/ureidoglycolate dehydrogenase
MRNNFLPQIQSHSKRLNHMILKRFGSEVLTNAGLKEPDAQLVSDSLVESNLRGIDSHGLARLPHYISRIRAGSIESRPIIDVKQLAPATSLVNGGNGLGQPVMKEATGEAIRLAKEAGAGWVAVNHSSHCGALSYYGLKIAEAGMIGLVFTHVDSMVVPHGSSEPFCGTNPICITTPGADNKMLCLDMSTSITPWNTIRNAATEGVPIPSGWAIDKNGDDTTDPNEVTAIHPFGEHKGSGLGIIIDVLCAMLSGSPGAPNIPKMYGDLSKHRSLGGLVGAIDISRFLPIDIFSQRVSEMMRTIGSLKPSQPNGRVLYPGEPEMICREERLANGIPLGLGVIEELNQCAVEYKVAPLTD